mmetsp:Transcript_8596/g.8480  ORF Transcript_8596/g.8480 Transcript_8596/m.8480 type:complete len:406 (-) Transcript_8596:62-1279(-)
MVQIKKSLLAFSSIIALGSAATSATSCNPVSTTNCPADKALATDLSEDFTSNSTQFEISSTESGISFGDDGLTMTIAKRFDNPALKSKFYIMFGRVEVHLKAANGTGIVSDVYLQSDDLDEIDIELLGGDDTQFQSNYFSKGDTTTYDRGEYHTVLGDSPQTAFHNYTIDWTEEECVWYLDGDAVRTLKNTSSEGYPQTPMYLMMGAWAGGDPSNAAGTIEWAGGETDYTEAPFSMIIKKLIVSDYSTGSEYSYSDQSGDWTSIEAKDGTINGRIDEVDIEGGDDSSSLSTESSSSASSTSSSDSSSSDSKSTASKTDSSASASTTSDKKTSSSKKASTSLEANATTVSSTKSDSAKKASSSSATDSSTTSAAASVSAKSSDNSGSSSTISSIIVGISIIMSILV